MKHHSVAVLAMTAAALALGVQGAIASEDRKDEREGWAALAGIQVEHTQANASGGSSASESRPGEGERFELDLLDRGALGLPEHVLLAQIGGLPYKSDEGSESAWDGDHNLIAPPQ